MQQGGGGNGLNGLTQPHIVGQHGPPAKSQMHGAFFLVRVQTRGKDVQRAVTLAHLLDEPLLLLASSLPIAQQIQVIAHGIGDMQQGALPARQVVDFVQEGRQCVQDGTLQNSFGVKVARQQLAQRGRLWQRL